MENEIEIGTIYKITCNETNEVYIGSTKNGIERRLKEHKNSYNGYMKGNKKYLSSFEIVKFHSAKIETISIHYDVSKMQLHKFERIAIESFENVVNLVIPTRTMKEYRIEEKQTIAETNKKYKANNKEKIVEVNKQYYQRNKEKILEERNKYKANNKEKIAEARKKYYQSNKEKIGREAS